VVETEEGEGEGASSISSATNGQLTVECPNISAPLCTSEYLFNQCAVIKQASGVLLQR
jgi:hypothetical protein